MNFMKLDGSFFPLRSAISLSFLLAKICHADKAIVKNRSWKSKEWLDGSFFLSSNINAF